MNNLNPKLRREAKELLKATGGKMPEAPEPKWLVVPALVAVFAFYIPILMFAPMWLQLIATGYVIFFLLKNRNKIIALFK